MDARRVHSVMAAGLSDPDRLSRWRRRPDVLQEMRVGLETAQAESFVNGLWKFAGMGEKIRYTNCRNDLPLTFRLLAHAGLEIQVFANLTGPAAALRLQGKKSSLDKIATLVAFLREWHDPSNRDHALLWDLIRHEAAIAELTYAAPLQQTFLPEEKADAVSAGSSAHTRGLLRLHRMRFDPRRITAELRKQTPNMGLVEGSPVCLGYWLNPDRRILLLDVDDLVFDLLALVDGSRSIQEMTEYLANCGASVPTDVVLRAFAELQDAGVIAFE